jgi:hypothetical protein
MFKTINNILSKLPFNGSKTGIGLVVTVLGLFFPGLPLGESEIQDVIQSLATIVEALGNIYLVVGVLHKYIKAKA